MAFSSSISTVSSGRTYFPFGSVMSGFSEDESYQEDDWMSRIENWNIGSDVSDLSYQSQPYSEAASTAVLKDEIPEGAEELAEITGEAVEVGSSLEGPAALAMMVGQQLGSAVSSGFSNVEEQQVTSSFIHNSMLPGIGAQQQAQLIQQNMQQNVSNDRTAMNIGTVLMGPIGALIGHAVASFYYNSPMQSSQLDTAFSSSGRINPQDTGIVASLNTNAATGVTLQDQGNGTS